MKRISVMLILVTAFLAGCSSVSSTSSESLSVQESVLTSTVEQESETMINPNYSRISGIAYENGYVRENSSKTDTLQSFPPNKGALLPWGSDNF